jgi:hypothetical protein
MESTHEIYPRADLARRYLDRLRTSPNRALSIFGPRQIGKTTFVHHDLATLAHRDGLLTLYVDFMGTTNNLEQLNARLGQLVHDAQSSVAHRKVRGARLGALSVDLEPLPPPTPSGDPGIQLQNAFATLNRLRPRVTLLLLLDEAQELVRNRHGEATMKAIRALYNTFLGQILLVITGSSREGLLRLFGDRHRASFGLADHEDFPRLGREFVEAKSKVFNALRRRPIDIDTLLEAFAAMEHRPADFIAFLEYLALHDVRDVIGCVPTFLRTRYPLEAIRDRFERYTPLQQVLLVLLAAGERRLMGAAGLERIAGRLGASVSAAGVRKALSSLPPDVVANPARGEYEIVDTHLLALLREPGPAAA